MAHGHYSSLTRTSYNEENGLVYSEIEAQGRKGASNWIVEYRTPKLVKSRTEPNPGPGVRTLLAMALNKVGTVSQDLSVEALRALPFVIGELIWQRICDIHAVSFHIWRTFAAAYGSDFADKAYRYHLDIKMPANRLSDYYRGLDSPQLYWLSCLRISPKQISVPDLVSIAGISNLAVLDLSDGQLYIDNRESTLDLRVFRTWTDLARTGRAFKHLRVLLLGWQENIGAWIFDLLKHFPKLDTIVMTDCKNINHRNSKEWADLAHAAGWNFWPTKRGVKHMRSHISRSSSGVSSIAYLYDMTSESGAARADAFPTARQYPLLECWLGTPRVWSHIVDDFPSTRTVFLQKNFGNRPLHVGAPDPAAQIFSETKTDAKKVATVADKLRTRRRREPCNTASGLLSDMASY